MKINDAVVTSEAEIIAVLEKVMAGTEDFAVLERDSQHFIQTAGDSLEYKNPAGLYQAEQQEFTLEELIEVFLNYSRGVYDSLSKYQWKEIPGVAEWEPEEVDDRPPPRNLREKIRRLFGL